MAGQIAQLKYELDNDPLVVGYSGMTNLEATDSLNDSAISVDKSSVSTKDVLDIIDSVALLALTGDAATRVWGILAMDNVDPFGIAADIFVDAFGVGSATIIALSALRVENISRAKQLGYPGIVKEGHVEMARAL